MSHSLNEVFQRDDYSVMVMKHYSGEQFEVLLDNEDVERVLEYPWCVRKSKTTNYAQVIKKYPCDVNVVHRLVMGLNKGDGLVVDHLNHNGLDNRKSNLRVCTQKDNTQSYRKRKGSKYIGVFRNGKQWAARIGKDKFIGLFNTGKKAALAYDAEVERLDLPLDRNFT